MILIPVPLYRFAHRAVLDFRKNRVMQLQGKSTSYCPRINGWKRSFFPHWKTNWSTYRGQEAIPSSGFDVFRKTFFRINFCIYKFLKWWMCFFKPNFSAVYFHSQTTLAVVANLTAFFFFIITRQRLQIFPSERHGVRSAEANDFHDAITLSFFQKALSEAPCS